MRDILVIVPTLDMKAGLLTARAACATAGCIARPFVMHDRDGQGFTATANMGFEAAAPREDLCILNDDIECFPPGWLATLQSVMYSGDKIGIVAPSGTSRSTPSRGRLGDGGLVDVNSVPFWCALIRSEVRAELGVLNPSFIHYSSDTWYCWMARHAGWRLVWVRSVYLWHTHQASGYRWEWKRQDTKMLARLVKETGMRMP